MKKLLLAALALVGLAAPQRAGAVDLVTLSSPVTELTDGEFYYIYDSHADNGLVGEQTLNRDCRYAIRKAMDTTAGSNVMGTHIKPINAYGTLDNFSVWKAISTGSGTWKFQNMGNSFYISGTSGNVSVNVEGSATAFELEAVNNKPGSFTVKVEGTTNTRWDGNENTQMVYWGGDGHQIQFYHAVANDDNGYNFDVTPIANFPEFTTDTSNPQYYLIKNLRVRNGRGPTYAVAPGASGQIALHSETELTQYTGRYEIGALWYFMSCEAPEEVQLPVGYIPVKIYNALTGQALANVLSGDWRTEGNDIIWYITPNTSGSLQGFNIISTPNAAASGSSWNNAGGNGYLVEYYQGNDVGSIFGFEQADQTLTEETLDAIVANRTPLAIEKGNVLKKLGVSTDEALAAWNAAVEAAEADDTEATIEEYQAVISAYINLQKSVKESNIRIRHKTHEYEYVGVENTEDLRSEIHCIGTADDDDLGRGSRVFTLVPVEDGSGFYIHNIFEDCYIVHPNNNTNNVTTTTEKSQASVYNFDVWVDNSVADGSIGLLEINSKPDVAYLKSTEENTKLIRGAFDANASWFIESATDEMVEENQLKRAQAIFSGIKTKANLLVNLEAIKIDAKTTWTTAAAAFDALESYDEDTINAAYEAFSNLQSQINDNVSITAKHKACDRDYICVNAAGNMACAVNQPNTRALTLTMAESGKGFNIFSEYAGAYITHPTADNGSVGLTTNKSQASVYNFDVWVDGQNNADSYMFFEVNTSKDRAYFNTNSGLSVVTRWSYIEGSAWYIETIDADQAANEYLAGAKANYNTTVSPFLGTGLGNYSLSAESQSAVTAALAVDDTASNAEKRNAGDALRNCVFSLNMPVAGHFYRFHLNNDYMSSGLTNAGRFSIINESNPDNLDNKTVFYFDGSHLITFPEGLAMGNLDTADTDGFKGHVLGTTTNVGVFDFSESPYATGKYAIHSSNGRYLFHATDHTDSGTSLGTGTGYQWEITEVTWLPIPHDGGKYISVYSPVALEKSYNRIGKHHTGTLGLTSFTKEPQTHENIPANTPFLLEYNEDGGMTNGCVYLQIQYPSEASVALFSEENTSDLNGSHLAQPKAENTTYFTVNGEKFTPHTGDYVPGFTAHLAVPSENAAEEYAITDPVETEIGEISVEKAEAVYDLQGRRMAAPVKGINIINGKKVLVK